MQHANPTIDTIVKSASQGEYAVPEFQRGFVWSPRQVRELADSLVNDFPVGSILTWKSNTALQRGDGSATRQKSWLIDGQQRTTALCTIFGKRPEWWDTNNSGTWDEHLERYNLCLDISQDDLTLVMRKRSNQKRFVRVIDVLACKDMYPMATELVNAGVTFSDGVGEIAQRLHKLVEIKRAILPVVEIDDAIELTDVAEIFKRLNSTGTRVQQADIYLGVIAARNPGWVNSNFLKFNKKLNDDWGFEIEPAFLFRTLTAIGAKRSRFRDVPQEFWENPDRDGAWEATIKAWESTLHGLRNHGIVNSNIAVSVNALVVMVMLKAKFGHGNPFGPVFALMIDLIRDEFFSGPIESRLQRVISAIDEADSQNDAIERTHKLLRGTDRLQFDPSDFIETSGRRNSIERLMVYILAYDKDARDWSRDGYRIRAEAQGRYRPEWHHIFPRSWLLKNNPDLKREQIDSVANMAIISGEANRRISDSQPCDYISKLQLDPNHLNEQSVPDPTFVGPDKYLDWLNLRGERLAKDANEFLERLRKQD